MMRVNVKLFAQARERVGSADARLELPAGSRVSDALASLERTYPALAELRPHLAVAVDGTLARSADALPGDCELALLPPVSGG
jgi:molybdopterin converting factor small subunit